MVKTAFLDIKLKSFGQFFSFKHTYPDLGAMTVLIH